MRVAVIGAGAIGGWVAGRLALAGHEVSIVARGASAAAIRDGLTLVERNVESIAYPHIVTDTAELQTQDVLIIAVKAPAMADAAETSRTIVGPDTLLEPMMNGDPWRYAGAEP